MIDRDDTLMEVSRQSTGAKLWRPVRRLVSVDHQSDQITKLQKAVHPPAPAGITKVIPGIPKQLTSITATESPVKQTDRTFSAVSVSFTRDGNDPTYNYTRIYLKGYKGNTGLVLQADTHVSPVTFLLETTNELISVIGVPVGLNGMSAPIETAQSCTVLLDGVTSAPPAPSISQSLATLTAGATTIGQQFGFNYLSGLTSDMIAGYWVYKVGSHSAPTPPASRFKFVLHNPQGSGSYTFQDLSGVSTNFYYVSAVNKAGLESSLTDAGAGGGASPPGGTKTTYRPSTSDTSDYSPAARVYDGNEASYASADALPTNTLQTVWSGFSAISGSPTAVTLKILTSAEVTAGVNTFARIEYSTDSGSSWTTVYSLTDGDRAVTTDSISLSTSVDLTHVQVRATARAQGSGAESYHVVYEVWCEVTV